MTKHHTVISPIALDLGAKNTGAFYAHYDAGIQLEDLKGKTEGKVYVLEKNKHTLLMNNRTSNRHQRRGFDRRQMVKRLFKLIWCEHFELKWDKSTQQAISFLLNRRGFSFITEEYDEKILSEFPHDAYKLLPSELKKHEEEQEHYDYATALRKWSQDEQKIKDYYEVIFQKTQIYNIPLREIQSIIELKNNCDKVLKGKGKPTKDYKVGKNNLKTWDEKGIKGIEIFNVGSELYKTLKEQDESKVQEILDSIPDTKAEEKNLKAEDWCFDISNFKLEKADFDNDDIFKDHLRHLAFALHKIKTELESGARYRSKYFEEIKNILTKENHEHKYLKNFVEQLKAEQDIKAITQLIGHLSNLELKPLRKYFNDIEHKQGDKWNEKELSEIFNNWILREWRVSAENDGKDKVKTYGKLKKIWKEYTTNPPDHIIDFWLQANPELTIPPYQNNNNRRPPHCQSLTLNPKYLDAHYPEWQQWLKELKDYSSDYLQDYEQELKDLKSSKDKGYFEHEMTNNRKVDSGRRTQQYLDARVFQFILDRTKKDDGLKLNEIYSRVKKLKQDSREKNDIKDTERNALRDALTDSCLSEGLKEGINQENGNVNEETFLHCVCKYYKLRQRARDSRLFIHPRYRVKSDGTVKKLKAYDDKNHLLTYCNHKPRQKYYQCIADVAAIFQVSTDDLMERVGIEGQAHDKNSTNELRKKLGDIAGLKICCQRSASAQKRHRGRLKMLVNQIKAKHKGGNEKVSDDDDLNYLYKKNTIEDIAKEIAKKLYPQANDEEINDKEIETKASKFNSVFSFAQLHNILFDERSGFSNTCPVCSMDNALRMQIIEDNAKASRLTAITSRLIDGAVMRMARIVGTAIVSDKWEKIKNELEQDIKVHIPIITEMNRFEFEPNLASLKGRKADTKSTEKGASKKSNTICPYTGNLIGENGEWDHIIPRSSKWGILNDTANLILASEKGNKTLKGTRLYSLDDLNDDYKRKIFNGKSDDEITSWIKDTIDAEGERFKFGKYKNFYELDKDQQKAFQHALFLVGSDLRTKVIKAIDHKMKTLVNGTQRYFAETIANEIHQKAKVIHKEDLLTFDYFAVESGAKQNNVSTSALRRTLEEFYPELKSYEKIKEKPQKPYSHLMDAQVAFVLVADAHRDSGSMKIEIPSDVGATPFSKETGEVYENNIFKMIKVEPNNFDEIALKRQKATENNFEHKTLFDSNPGAWHFLNLLEIKSSDDETPVFLQGFLDLNQLKECLGKECWKESLEQEYGHKDGEKDGENILSYAESISSKNEGEKLKSIYLQFGCLKKEYQLTTKDRNNTFTVVLHKMDKTKVAEFLMKNFNTATKSNEWKDEHIKIYEALYDLWYFTKRVNLKDNIEEEYKKACKVKGVYSPSLLRPWIELQNKYQSRKEENNFNLQEFLKDYFKPGINTRADHERVRKNFSLPQNDGFSILIRRKSWDEEKGFTYQVQSKKDGGAGVNLCTPYCDLNIASDKNQLIEVLNPYFRSKSVVLLKPINKLKKHFMPVEQLKKVDGKQWYALNEEQEKLKDYHATSVKNKYISGTNSMYQFKFNGKVTMRHIINVMENHQPIQFKNKAEFEKLKAKNYFKYGDIYLTIEKGQEKLSKDSKNLEEEIKKLSGEKNKKKQEIQEKQNKREIINNWINILKSIDVKNDEMTLEYERKQGLKIYNQ